MSFHVSLITSPKNPDLATVTIKGTHAIDLGPALLEAAERLVEANSPRTPLTYTLGVSLQGMPIIARIRRTVPGDGEPVYVLESYSRFMQANPSSMVPVLQEMTAPTSRNVIYESVAVNVAYLDDSQAARYLDGAPRRKLVAVHHGDAARAWRDRPEGPAVELVNFDELSALVVSLLDAGSLRFECRSSKGSHIGPLLRSAIASRGLGCDLVVAVGLALRAATRPAAVEANEPSNRQTPVEAVR